MIPDFLGETSGGIIGDVRSRKSTLGIFPYSLYNVVNFIHSLFEKVWVSVQPLCDNTLV